MSAFSTEMGYSVEIVVGTSFSIKKRENFENRWYSAIVTEQHCKSD